MLTAEQRELRRTGIGASEIAILAGLSRFKKTPLDVWREKVERVELEEEKHMRRGRMLEPAVLNWYAEDTGAKLEQVGTLRHPDLSWILATPDALALLPTGEARTVEAKTAAFYAATEFGDAGTDQIPADYAAQVTWAMAVTGREAADLPVLISGDDFRIFTVPFDPGFFAMLRETGERFWRDHVLTQKPPPFDYSDPSTSDYLAKRYPSEKQRKILRPATDTEAMLIDQLRESDAALKAAKKTNAALVAQLKEAIADGAGLTVGADASLRVSWLKNKDGTKTDWKGLAQSFNPSADQLQAFTRVTPGARVFRKSWTRQDNEGEE